MALVSMGIKHNSLESYAQRARRLVLPTPTQAVATKQIGILQTGQKRPHPSHIPDHLPAFPDSHAYVQTPVCIFFKYYVYVLIVYLISLISYSCCVFKTHKQPITDYETIREKASCQKRDVERALTRFVAKTGETQSFFSVEDLTHYPRKKE